MADTRPTHSTEPGENRNGVAGTVGKSGEEMHGEPALPKCELNSAPPMIEQMIFDRLNAALDEGQAKSSDGSQRHTLERLGGEIRQWRLHQGYTRSVLAGKLQMDVNQLTSLENGIAQADDFSRRQLLALKALVSDTEPCSLVHAIEEYLAALDR
jgi:hypothetical protein